MTYLLLIVGFYFLIRGADVFVEGSSNLAKVLRIPTLIIGLTVVAFGTSAPEAAVSVTASLGGRNAISIGNVVGSNICNLLLVLGVTALFKTVHATKKVIVRDYLFSILSAVILLIMVADEFMAGNTIAIISHSEGLLLLCFLGVYLHALILDAFAEKKKLEVEKKKFSWLDIGWIIAGIIGIVIGGNLVVDSAVKIAQQFHVSENLIALTIVAIGTSLPELVTSVVAAKKGEADIAIGNVIGSNIFNIFFILGLSASITPLIVVMQSLIDILVMGIAEVLVYFLMLKKFRVSRRKGIFMLALYASYLTYIVIR